MLDERKVTVAETRPSKTRPLSDADVKALLASVEEVVIAKGKAQRRLAAKDATPDDLKGPTGSYRAPMLKKGKTLVVGFSPAVLDEVLGGSRKPA